MTHAWVAGPLGSLDPPSDQSVRDCASRAAGVRYTAWLLALLGVIALCGRLCYLVRPYDGDGAVFVYMGKLVGSGGRIGWELIDNKFPTVGLICSGAWRLFGTWWPGYLLLQTVMVLGAIALLAHSTCRNLNRSAALAVTAYALVFLNFSFVVDGGFRLETMQSSFAIAAAAAALSAILEDDARDALVVGLCAGVAAMFKPSGLAVLAAFAMAIILCFARRPARIVRHGLAAAVGLAVPSIVCLVYLAGSDTLRQMPALWREISHYASGSAWDVWELGKWVAAVVVLGFPFLIQWRVFRPAGDERAADQSARTRAVATFAILWLVMESAGVVAQGRMYLYHFLVLAGPAALMFGMLPRPSRPRAMVAALGPPLALSTYGVWVILQHVCCPTARLPTSDYFASPQHAGECVWKDNLWRLMVETDLRPGSRYPMTFLWANDDDAPQRLSRAMLADFRETRPQHILLPHDVDAHVAGMCRQVTELELNAKRRANFVAAWAEVRRYVEQNYLPEAEVDGEMIYRRVAK